MALDKEKCSINYFEEPLYNNISALVVLARSEFEA